MQRVIQMIGEVVYAIQQIGNLVFIKAQNQRTQTSQQLIYICKGNAQTDNDNVNQVVSDMVTFCTNE
jgi:hypothetical protein